MGQFKRKQAGFSKLAFCAVLSCSLPLATSSVAAEEFAYPQRCELTEPKWAADIPWPRPESILADCPYVNLFNIATAEQRQEILSSLQGQCEDKLDYLRPNYTQFRNSYRTAWKLEQPKKIADLAKVVSTLDSVTYSAALAATGKKDSPLALAAPEYVADAAECLASSLVDALPMNVLSSTRREISAALQAAAEARSSKERAETIARGIERFAEALKREKSETEFLLAPTVDEKIPALVAEWQQRYERSSAIEDCGETTIRFEKLERELRREQKKTLQLTRKREVEAGGRFDCLVGRSRFGYAKLRDFIPAIIAPFEDYLRDANQQNCAVTNSITALGQLAKGSNFKMRRNELSAELIRAKQLYRNGDRDKAQLIGDEIKAKATPKKCFKTLLAQVARLYNSPSAPPAPNPLMPPAPKPSLTQEKPSRRTVASPPTTPPRRQRVASQPAAVPSSPVARRQVGRGEACPPYSTKFIDRVNGGYKCVCNVSYVADGRGGCQPGN